MIFILLITTVYGCSYQQKLKAAIYADAKLILEKELNGYDGEKMPHHLNDRGFINYYGGFYIEQMARAREQPKASVYTELTDLDVLYKLGMPEDQDIYQGIFVATLEKIPAPKSTQKRWLLGLC